MSVAQELCDEICEEPVKKPPGKGIVVDNKRALPQSASYKYHGRPTRSIVIEKQKEVNKVVPKGKSNIVINKFKSKETLMKKRLVDTAVNTIITEPLTSDNECVTMVRKRHSKCCKCIPKRSLLRPLMKEVQTNEVRHYLMTDKACAQCVEMVSHSTQFVGSSKYGSGVFNLSNGYRSKLRFGNDVDTQTCEIIVTKPSFRRNQAVHKTNYDLGAKAWALSQYPRRGPDF